uniref:Uncharacterized protein n=1 Tax=Rhizophora mucronata TaxID=61149 RepID=A0A2P2N9F9_RHIMU
MRIGRRTMIKLRTLKLFKCCRTFFSRQITGKCRQKY